MPGAQIAFNQVGNPIPFGTPGVARDDIWQSNPVVCQSTLSGNVTYQWQFLDLPPGSAASFTGGSTTTATFTPDLLGTYRIQLTTNGGGLGNVMILVIRVRYNSVGDLMYDGICLPAFGERVGEDNVLIPPVSGPKNARGYAPFFESLLAYVLTLVGGVGYSTIKHEGASLPQRSVVSFDADAGSGTTIQGTDDGTVTHILISSPDVYTENGTAIYTTVDNNGTTLNQIPVGGSYQIISAFLLDNTTGPSIYDMSAANIENLQDGWIYILTDPAASWGTQGPPTIDSTDGTEFTVPGCPGTTSSQVVLPACNGASIAFMYDGSTSPGTWRMLWQSTLGGYTANTTGPSQAGTLPLPGTPVDKTATYAVCVTMRVVSVVGTPTEQVGDSYITEGVLSWSNVSGTVGIVPNLQGLSDVAAHSSMATGGSTTQNTAGVAYVTPSGLDSGTVVSVTLSYTLAGMSP